MSLDSLSGEWNIQQAVESGRATPPGKVRLVIRGHHFARVTAEHTFERWIEVDDTVLPHTIDLHITNEPQQGQLFKGIYQLDGDTLTICHALPGESRPSEFSSTVENRHVLSISTRVSMPADQ